MTAIPATEKKLREVHFFFDHLLRAKDRFPVETEQAEFFLSAFLSAARSVTWVLQAEQKRLYDNWFRTWLVSRLSEEQKLLTFMNEQRVDALHVRGARTTIVAEYTPVTGLPGERGLHPVYGFHSSGPPGVPPPEVAQPVLHFEINETVGEEVITECKRYLALLDELVGSFREVYQN